MSMTDIDNKAVAVHPRSPLGAMALSVVVPGLGSMYAGSPWRGALILAAYTLAWLYFWAGFAPAAILAIPCVFIFGLWHGVRSAKRWNRDHGVIS